MGLRIALCIMDTAADLVRLQGDLAAGSDGGPRHTRRFVMERLAGRTAGAGGRT